MVGFEGGNAEKPFVMGAHYNGSEISSYHTVGNDIKVIHAEKATGIILNDGSLLSNEYLKNPKIKKLTKII